MRLVLLSPLSPEPLGPADEAATYRRALNAAGLQVLTPLWGQRPIDSRVAAQRWVDERDWSKVDVVHAELGGGRVSEFLVLEALSRLPGHPPLSATAHDPDRLIWRSVPRRSPGRGLASVLPVWLRRGASWLGDPFALWAERRLARRLDGLVAHTELGAARLAARMGLPGARVSTIARGVHPLPEHPLPPLQPLRLICVSDLCRGQGLEDLMDALGRVLASAPERASQVRLTMARGAFSTLPLDAQARDLETLKKRAAQRGLQDLVDWEVELDPRDVGGLIQRHHLLVHPTRGGRPAGWLGQMRGTSDVLTWALASGRGVITSDACAFAEEVRAGNGQSYPSGDVEALAQRLSAVLADPGLLLSWAHHATELAQQRDWRVIGARLAAHFDAVAALRRR